MAELKRHFLCDKLSTEQTVRLIFGSALLF